MSTPPRVCLWIAAFAVTCTVALGQGTVWFRNRIVQQFQPVDVPFFDDEGRVLEGPGYVAQLFFWTTGEGFQPAAGDPVPFSTNGYFYGESILLPFVPECGSTWVQVRAWDFEAGSTFEQAARSGRWSGVSSILFLTPLGSPGRPEACLTPTLFGLDYPGTPLLIQQPRSETVLVGEPATLSVIASSGVLMDYQWYQRPSNRPDGLIPGATNATYTTAALLTNATFWVSITNSAGSVFSDEATITVLSSAPQFSLEQAAGLPVLTLAGEVGVTYRIEYSTNLSTASWASLVELSLSASPFTFTDSTGSNSPARFYRALAP